MKKILPFLLSMILLLLAVSAGSEEGWRQVAPGNVVRLPADLYFRKDYRIQWWYFTGHLFDASGREFGYELTFFAAGVQQKKYISKFGINVIYLSHFAVSDIQNNKFYHFSNADTGAYGFASADDRRLQVRVGDASLEGSQQEMHIRASAGDLELDLALIPNKPFVLHGENGYSRKSQTLPLIASLYFSNTDLATSGTLRIGKEQIAVTGKSWFDRELSSKGLSENEAGWDWFAIMLEDGREIMLYEIRKKDGTIDAFSSGTVVQKNGNYRHLGLASFTVKILESYTSKHTRVKYPSKWEVAIPSENLSIIISPLIRDQEFTAARAIKNLYWEGACSVQGTVKGRAYVEMTGYQ